MNWHVVSVTSGYEIKSAARISDAGFNAVCPTWLRKIRRPHRGGILFRSKIEPLFSRYFFVQENESFQKSKFETETVRLKVLRNGVLTPEQMQEVRLIEMKVASEQMRAKHALRVEVGEVIQVIHGIMQGEPVVVSKIGKGTVEVRLQRIDGARPFWINADSVAKAV